MDAVSTIVTQAWSWFAEAFTQAQSHTEMYIPLAIGIVGASIGLFKRAVRIGSRKSRG